jgi:hypothetical protein
MAVQVHSRRYHADPEDWERTVMADGALAEHGIVVVGVAPSALARDPDAVLQRLARAYQAASRRFVEAGFVFRRGLATAPSQRTVTP